MSPTQGVLVLLHRDRDDDDSILSFAFSVLRYETSSVPLILRP